MNIYDVSGHAGVSIATVSRVLNGNPNVSERTRKKVLAVMDELGYTLPIPILLRRSIIWNGSCAVMITTLSSAVPVTTWM